MAEPSSSAGNFMFSDAASGSPLANTSPESPKSESGDPLLDAVPIDCLGLSVGSYERLPRAKSHTTDDGEGDDDNHRSEHNSSHSPKPHRSHRTGILGRLLDHKPKKPDVTTPKADGGCGGEVVIKVECSAHKVDCGVQTDDDSDGGLSAKEEKKKKKKRSSWLPDPEKRWPIQGFY